MSPSDCSVDPADDPRAVGPTAVGATGKRRARAGSVGGPGVWTEAQAESRLRSLELFGMRFGLDRMRRMMTALGSPEQGFEAVHVLGTNGKSSTTRMTAAILERHGLRTGAYLSPHLLSYRERVRVGERELAADAFAESIARASWAAERVNRTLAEDDHVTQFELLTAAALWQIAEQHLDVAVVEAGLGGRYDATSVVEAGVTVLTNVGLEHTRWLGPTIKDIAEEKLAVVRPDATLVLGAGLAEPAMAVAERVARERGARIVRPGAAQAGAALIARGAFQRTNFALARAAAAAHLERAGIALREQAVLAAAGATEVPGRLQLLDGEPPTVLDGAHNPDAVDALVASLPEVLGEGPLALVLGVLEDKDAARMLGALLPLCERAWFTAPPSSRALSPGALQSLARQLGFHDSACEPRPAQALAQARSWARERGGSVLATGSVYLVGDLLAQVDRSGTLSAPGPHPQGSST
jgi:dihydrofolate synthase/folylpolyglutamate synthase